MLDLRDGIEDGKMGPATVQCAYCGKPNSSIHDVCLYCGSDPELRLERALP